MCEALHAIFEHADYDLNREPMVLVDDDEMEELCGYLLQVQELRTALAMQVSSLLQETKKGFDSPTKSSGSKQTLGSSKTGGRRKV